MARSEGKPVTARMLAPAGDYAGSIHHPTQGKKPMNTFGSWILKAVNRIGRLPGCIVSSAVTALGFRARHSSSAPAQLFICGSLLFLLTDFAPVCFMQNREPHRETEGLEQALLVRDYDMFISGVSKNPWYKSSRNELLRNLDSGIATVYKGDYRESTNRLIKVGDKAEEYYTKSVTANVLSVLTNDLALPYYGEDYEVTFAGTAASMAFAANGDIEGALVESRRSEQRLGVISQAYEGKNKYSDDAFAHYLAGMLFEASGNYNDAVVSYKLAYNGYGGRFFPVRPAYLTKALVGASRAGGIDPGFGFQSLADSLAQADPEISMRADPDSSAAFIGNSMIVVAFTGKGPKKTETVISAHFTDKGVDYVVKVALPEIKRRASSIASVQLRIDGGDPYPMELAADYNHIGENAFNDKRSFIYMKTIARVSVRYLAMREVKEKSLKKLREKYDKAVEDKGKDSDDAKSLKYQIDALEIGLDLLANELLEHADTRCSLAIPGSVYIARVPVLPDSHTVRVEYLDRSGGILDKEEQRFLSEPGNNPLRVFTALF
ncbi:hypothetical protein LLG96_03640 [bacterium]|nr:hypothetical protein [bacterium]